MTVLVLYIVYDQQWRSQDFEVGGHTGDVARRVDAGWGFGEGQRSGPPPHQLRGLGRAVSSPSGVQAGAPEAE